MFTRLAPSSFRAPARLRHGTCVQLLPRDLQIRVSRWRLEEAGADGTQHVLYTVISHWRGQASLCEKRWSEVKAFHTDCLGATPAVPPC